MAVDYEVKFSHTGIDFEELKRTSVDGDITLPSRGREVNFQEHICMLEKEFCGRSELELYVIWLTVKIRRGIDLIKSVNSFFSAWENETEFLLSRFSSRWLVSACDTYIDHAKRSKDVAFALGAVFFMNTVKLYETEYKMFGWDVSDKPRKYLTAKTALFDGVTAYNAQGGDMIKNMLYRLETKAAMSSVTARIFQELVRRSTAMDTVYLRMYAHQKDPMHRW